MVFESFPLIVGWELTLKCNLRCKHCGSSAGKARLHELSTSEALNICDQFPDLCVQEVDFTGGEALLRKDWAEIAKYLINKKIRVNILTNGLDVDENKIKLMQDVGVTGVGISIDGLEQSHDYIRSRKGSFKSVIQCIRDMKKNGMSFNVITTVNRMNLSELPALYKMLQNEGVTAWRLQSLLPFGRVKEHADLHMDDACMFELGSFLEYYVGKKSPMKIICSDGLEYINESENEKQWHGCSAGIVACGITSDGKIKGCLSMPDELIEGDLRKDEFWNIWFNEKSFAYTRTFKNEHLGENCFSCKKAEECKGGCSANSWAGTHKFHNDPYCFYKLKNLKLQKMDEMFL